MRHRWREGGDVITGRGGRTLVDWHCVVCTETVYTAARRPRSLVRCAGPCYDLGGWTGGFCVPPVPEPVAGMVGVGEPVAPEET
jgi:hypothetical protein